jgi:hypothetical protein
MCSTTEDDLKPVQHKEKITVQNVPSFMHGINCILELTSVPAKHNLVMMMLSTDIVR